jgi:hypothetical protein
MAPAIPMTSVTADWAPPSTAPDNSDPFPKRTAAATDSSTIPVQIQLISIKIPPVIGFYAELYIYITLKFDKIR